MLEESPREKRRKGEGEVSIRKMGNVEKISTKGRCVALLQCYMATIGKHLTLMPRVERPSCLLEPPPISVCPFYARSLAHRSLEIPLVSSLRTTSTPIL